MTDSDCNGRRMNMGNCEGECKVHLHSCLTEPQNSLIQINLFQLQTVMLIRLPNISVCRGWKSLEYNF